MFLKRAEQAVDDAKRTISASAIVSIVSLVVAFLALVVAVSK